MHKFLFFLLIPFSAFNQSQTPVQPLLSKDYSQLIQQSYTSAGVIIKDSSLDISVSKTKTKQNFLSRSIKRINKNDSSLTIQYSSSAQLRLSIQYGTGFSFKKQNNSIKLQKKYVQGRSQGGVLTWRGPETEEQLSFGPNVSSLEYDGSAYAYDVNGSLVTTGSGNGKPANVYNNTILRTGNTYFNDLKLSGHLRTINNDLGFELKYSGNNEKYFIKENRNSSHLFSAQLYKKRAGWQTNAGYTYLHDDYANDNSHGFLNRAYQNALLTPVSFSNEQSITVGNAQRSFSNTADNALFLLRSNGNSFTRNQHNGFINIEKQISRISFKLSQSAEDIHEITEEGYKPTTAGFNAGIHTKIKRHHSNYTLMANSTYRIETDNYNLKLNVSGNYIFVAARSAINYTQPANRYIYGRNSHDYSLNFMGELKDGNMTAIINAGNKMYVSNTVTNNKYLLPYVNTMLSLKPGNNNLEYKLVASYNLTATESPLRQSYTQLNLLKYATAQAQQYFPNQEVNSYANINAAIQRQLNINIEVFYKNKLSFSAEVFTEALKDAVYPILKNGNITLKNIAATRTNGVDLSIRSHFWPRSNKFSYNGAISFNAFNNKVTNIKDGYNNTPVAGFSNVYKALVKGQPVGVIMGNSFLKNDEQQLIIGTEGFPIVDATPRIIGNPNPKFIMKAANDMNYKSWALQILLSWQNGGDVWNGTQAVLDYYGRSANTESLRNVKDYIFEGVAQNGTHNNTAVAFYNPALPVTENRWVRYGHTGVAEEYIQKADNVSISLLSLQYTKTFKKIIKQATLEGFVKNILLYNAYKGNGNNQPVYGQSNSTGLDFFNLPNVRSYGINLQIQF